MPRDASRVAALAVAADTAAPAAEPAAGWLTVAEAADRLGLDHSRVYALVRGGELEAENDLAAGGLRVSAASVERRRALGEVAGSPLTPANAWVAIAVMAADPTFEDHVQGAARPAMVRRIRARVQQEGLLALAPRLRRRAVLRRLTLPGARAEALRSDPAVVRTGPSAAAAYGWPLAGDLPLEVYVPQALLPELLDGLASNAGEGACPVWLRVVAGPWPFPPHRVVVPAALAALDLLDQPACGLREQARAVLAGLAAVSEQTVVRRDARARWRSALDLARTSGNQAAPPRPVPSGADNLLTDDAAAACHLVAVLHVAGKDALSRAELAEALAVPPERIDAAFAYLCGRPLLGLQVQRHRDHYRLVTAGACAASVERYLRHDPPPQPLSQAQREVLAIVAYVQPVTQARVDEVRQAQSEAAVAFLLQRGLIAREQPRPDAPAVLVTTAVCLAYLGLASLDELPPLPAFGAEVRGGDPDEPAA
jgi:segregation and condensation protein B